VVARAKARVSREVNRELKCKLKRVRFCVFFGQFPRVLCAFFDRAKMT
jgi:hypothetical protein